jgi:hypothetical protein
MGGSGGGGYFGGSRGGGGNECSCEDLRIRTAIVNPDLQVLRGLVVGSVLRVELVEDDPARPRVVLCDPTGREAGSIIPSSLPRLIQCLRNGYVYEARVLEISIPRCLVEIATSTCGV